METPSRGRSWDLLNPYRYFFGNDVFISYARSDGSEYARRLAHALTGQPDPLSVAFDHWQTHPGATPPQRLLRAARNATALVLIASPASSTSKAVDEEVAAFLHKPGPIILVSFRGAPYAEALWNPRLAGVAPAWEPGDTAALTGSDPDALVIERIRQALGFWRRNRRIKYSLGFGIGAFALASSAAVAAGIWANGELLRAEIANEMANEAQRNARNAETRAGAAGRLANREAARALVQQRRADGATAEADRQLAAARAATAAARTAEQQASVARAAAGVASARAERSLARAEATDLAQSAQNILVSAPERSREAAQLSIRSLERAPTSWGDLTLRRALMGMPAYRGSVDLRRNVIYDFVSHRFERQVAAGPGGLLVRWSAVEGPGALFDVALTDTGNGTDTDRTMRIAGFIGDVQFPPGPPGALLRVSRSGDVGDPQRLILIEPGDAAPVELPPADVVTYAVNPSRREVAIGRPEAVEIWSLTGQPRLLETHPVRGVTSLSYRPDGASLFALEPGAVWTLASGNPTPQKLFDGSFRDASLTATQTHLIVGARSYNLATSSWDHEDLGAIRVLPVGDDRVLLVRQGEVELRDLARTSVAFEVSARTFACPRVRDQAVIVTDVMPSPDRRRLAMGCASGLAAVFDLQSGTNLEAAMLGDLWPVAIWFDRGGAGLRVYGERQRASVNPVTAELSSWGLVNQCPAPLQGDVAASVAALAPDGGSIAKWGLDGIGLWDVETGSLRARTPLASNMMANKDILALSANGDWAALSGLGGEMTLWDIARNRLIPLADFGRVVRATFDGPGPMFTAIVSSRGGAGRLVVMAPSAEGGWRRVHDEPAGIWTTRALPDDLETSPLAISGQGSIAYLAPVADGAARDPESFRQVNVRAASGGSWSVSAPSAVSALTFTSAGDLIVGTRDGRVLLARRGAPLQAIGRHDNSISMLLARSGSDEILAADRGNIMRSWKTSTTIETVGPPGYMEMPLSNYGISNSADAGVRGVAVRGSTLLTLHRDGMFRMQLLCWRLPASSALVGEAIERLGLDAIGGRPR